MSINSPQGDWEVYRLGEDMNTAIPRLLLQERSLIEQMGGVFPERENSFEGFTRVLDIACGTGTWAMHVARENPPVEVTGIEHHRPLVQYARGLAEAQEIENASFTLLLDAKTRYPFPDRSFDLVNAHFLFTFLHAEEWPLFVQECLRMVRPGGYLRLTEPEWETTNSPALEHAKALFLRGLKQRGQSLSPDDKQIGIVPQLPGWLAQAGATEISQRCAVHPYWTEPQFSRNPGRWAELVAQSIKPLLLSQGMITETDFEQLVLMMASEVAREDFVEVAYVVSVCGRRPERLRKAGRVKEKRV